MRILITFFLTVLCTLSLTGCAQQPEPAEMAGASPEAEAVVSPPAEETAAPAVPPVEETAPGEKTENLSEEEAETEMNLINLTVNGTTLTARLTDNSSAQALRELLAEGPLTIAMSDYGDMEKVGPLGTDLPTNNEQITTQAGDLILYQGSAFVIYYAPNSWSFTRLGLINDMTAEELKELLGDGDVEVTLSLPE